MREIRTENEVDILSEEQWEKLATIEDRRDKAIIFFLLATGLRVAELVMLDVGDVSENGQCKDVITLIGKGNKERKIPLSKAAKEAVKVLIEITTNRWNEGEQDYPLITGRYDRIGTRTINKIINKHIGCGPHQLRRTFATKLCEIGERIDIISSLLGHDDPKTTYKHYIAKTMEQKQNAVERMGELCLKS